MVSCFALVDVCAGARYGSRNEGTKRIMEAFIILYKYKRDGEKKPGPVRQFRIYAEDLEAARRQAERHANYPTIEVLDVHPV